MSSTSIITPRSAPQSDEHNAEILAHNPHESNMQAHDVEPCEHNQLTIPPSWSPQAPTHGETNADHISLVPSSPFIPALSSTPSPPVLIAGEASFVDTAHEIPLPPSTASSILQKASRVDTAHQIPLPPSAASSVVGDTFPFDATNEIPLPPSESSPEIEEGYVFEPACEIPLPPSAASSMSSIFSVNTVSGNAPMLQNPIGGEPEDCHGIKVKDIWNGSHRQEARLLETHIGQISKWLPHLGVLFPAAEMERAALARVKMHRISETVSTFENIDEFKVRSDSAWDKVRDRLSSKPLTPGTERIVLVEDLSPQLIIGLYAAFGIGPEIFAEHLNRSGYGISTYKDPDPSTWSFRSPKKKYVSIKWYRPVYKDDLVTMPPYARLAFGSSGRAEWREKKVIRSDDDTPRRAILTHTLTRCTNISRQQRPLSSVISDLGEEEGKKTLATIEERVTLYTEERLGQKIAVALVDPLPYINYSRDTQTGIERDALFEEENKLPIPVHPRSPPPVSSVDELLHGRNLIRSKTFFETQTSMLQDVEAWMSEYAHHGLPENANHLFVAILEIVSRDTRTTLSLLTATLSEISLGSMDDSQEQERLASWQALIRSYQADLPLMKDSLDEFVRWCFSDDIPPYVKRKVGELANRTDDLITRVEKAHQALRAELSILESKRGIAEAEGVAKLTELAFIFIPLTFSASLFSMQVKELEENMPTLAGFAGVCILLLFLSYGVRLAVRSRVVVDRKRELFRKIKVDSALDSKDIPTRVFVAWIIKKLTLGLFQERELGRLTFTLLFISAIFTPVLALIWTKARIDTGLKTVLTILLVSLAFVVGLYSTVRRLGVFFRKRIALRYLIDFRARGRRSETEGSVETV